MRQKIMMISMNILSTCLLLNLIWYTYAKSASTTFIPSTFYGKIDLKLKAKAREIYNVPGSTWNGPEWNWGYSVGTGHICAAICRKRWGTKESRYSLVEHLLNPSSSTRHQDSESPIEEVPFEEIKLVLALAWQRGKWDGSDGGRGGYGEVLKAMVQAKRYEEGTEEQCSRYFIQDITERFHLIATSDASIDEMNNLSSTYNNLDELQRKCSGLILKEMGFIENGI